MTDDDVSTRICPRCGAEYLATVDRCADCGASLRDASDEDGEEVAYELDDWTPTQREDLGRQLDAEGVPWRLEGDELVVAEVDADLVEELIDAIDNPDALAVEDDEVDEGAAELLSTLYVASDVLQGDPRDSVAVVELLEAAEVAATSPLPYGLDGDVWAEVLRSCEALADLLGEDSDDEHVMVAAVRLREVVRPLV